MNSIIIRPHVLLLAALFLIGGIGQGCATSGQAKYATADEAVTALISAVRTESDPALKAVLGPEAEQIVNGGDRIQNRNDIEMFLKQFDKKHRLVPEGDGIMILVVGDDDWPMAIPLVEEADGWRWDTVAGKEEVISRRVGRNELMTQQVCLAVVDAQREYAMLDIEGGGLRAYAQKFFSDAGKKNGLYWPVAEGERPSPLGPLVAEASADGYVERGTAENPNPFHGYCYRMLTSQGPGASGGAYDYIVNGRMIGGFAVLAYPAEYDKTGVMTFMVSHEGVLYERDLGKDTAGVARSIKHFDPSDGWTPSKIGS